MNSFIDEGLQEAKNGLDKRVDVIRANISKDRLTIEESSGDIGEAVLVRAGNIIIKKNGDGYVKAI